jgi:hypothetical protein
MLFLLFSRTLAEEPEDQTTLTRFHQELVAVLSGVIDDLLVRARELVDEIVGVKGDVIGQRVPWESEWKPKGYP